MEHSKVGALAESLAFAGPLALYVASLGPGVAFWDTGELQTVSNLLGIAHPTGFPVFVLGGWTFAHAFPLGSPAWRVSCFSAICAATACALLCRLARRITGSGTVGCAAALAFATGLVVWTRAARADAHDLALAFAAAALVAADAASRFGRRDAALGAALWAGLGLATHPVVVLALPAVFVLALGMPRPRASDLARIAAAALLPLALYAYVPLRSAYVTRHGLDPAATLGIAGGAFWNYGAPATADSFRAYLTASAFSPGAAFASAFTRPGAHLSFVAMRSVSDLEFGVLLAALIATGLVWLAIRETRVAIAFVLVALASAAFAPNFAAESEPVRYFLPALWAAGVCAGVGAWWFASAVAQTWLRSNASYAAMFAVLLLAFGASATFASAQRAVAGQRAATDASCFGADVARRTADGSIVIARWAYAAPLAYDAYVARTFGSRIVVSGAPGDEVARFAAWRATYGHVYLVTNGDDPLGPNLERRFASARWQLAEVRP